MYMSKILTSGCGITFPGERPTWVNVCNICSLDITDMSGPAISNTLILNQLIVELHNRDYTHVICQLTAKRKLDVELNGHNKTLMLNDSLRNFAYKGYWPSSTSADHEAKKSFYQYLYSPKIEEEDTILKLLQLQSLCGEKQTKLFIIQGYDMEWKNKLIDQVQFDKQFVIQKDYKQSDLYQYHDFSNENTVPNKLYQIELTKYINKNFLKLDDLHSKLERFDA